MLSRLSLRLLLSFSLLSHLSLAELSFSEYPEASQSCLYNAAQGVCSSYAEDYLVNSCLCNNDYGFVTNSAICITNNDPNDLQAVWNLMVQACDDTDTPIPFTEAQFLAAGKSGSTATTMITTTKAVTTAVTQENYQITTSQGAESTSQIPEGTTPASSAPSSDSNSNSNSNSNNDNVGHLSGGMIALISCVATVLATIIGVLVCCGCARRPRY
jgi:hypothetical protein